MKKKKNISTILFSIIIFLFFLLFFTKIHPIVVFDTDDWLYTTFSRNAIPMLSEWNPTRVFPETFMPLVMQTGNYILSIFSNDLVNNFILTNAFVVSIFITLYIYMFYSILKDKFKLKNAYNIFITILFIMLHFLIFRTANSNNTYMFYTLDACCYYYYLIPALLNISLVIYYVKNKTFYKKDDIFKSSLLLLACYLAIYSNLFQSVILASFIGVSLLIKIIDKKILTKRNFNIKNIISFIKENIIEIIILLAWLIAQIFEIQGGRANSLSSDASFISMLSNSFKELISVFNLLNKSFKRILLTSSIIGLIILFKEKLYKNRIFINSIFSILLTVIYLLLLCSKTGAWYIKRPDVLFGILFYIFILISFTLAYILKKYEKIALILPILVFLVYFEINTPLSTFKESNVKNISPEDCININKEIISQIIDASTDQSKIIYIPKFSSKDNWPIAKYGFQRIIDSLYEYGTIKNSFKGNFEISETYYKEKLGIIIK